MDESSLPVEALRQSAESECAVLVPGHQLLRGAELGGIELQRLGTLQDMYRPRIADEFGGPRKARPPSG